MSGDIDRADALRESLDNLEALAIVGEDGGLSQCDSNIQARYFRIMLGLIQDAKLEVHVETLVQHNQRSQSNVSQLGGAS